MRDAGTKRDPEISKGGRFTQLKGTLPETG